MERSAGVPGPQAMEAKVAEARPPFEEFFGTEHARLFGALCFITGDRDEAEEIMQDAFLRLRERWDQLRLDDASAYLFRTAMNVFRNRYRRTTLSLRKTLAIAPSDDPLRPSTIATWSCGRSAISRPTNGLACS
jgi:DNA-directed RNA polymerase specialized sigma24 family protein